MVLHTRVVTETGGGPDKTILLSAPFLADSPYWLAAAYMHPPDDKGFDSVLARAQQMDSPLISVPDRGPMDRKVLRRMLAICRHYDVKIWHGHDYKSNLLGLMLRPLWPMKLVSTVHGWVKHTLRTPLYYAVDRWCLPYYHHVVCVSEDLIERVSKLGVAPDRLTLIHNAIDEKTYRRRYPADQSPLRSQMDVAPGRLVIGAVGRLSPEKGFSDLITATSRLTQDGLDVETWIIGDGDHRGDLEQLIKQLGVTGRVKLLGFRSDMIDLYHAMDLFVLSSLREGLPNVVLEAMALCIPVVATRVAGIPSLIRDGSTGLLCPIGDADQLTDAIRRVASDAQLRADLSGHARTRIEQSYSFTGRMAKMKTIYDQVLGIEHPATDPQQIIPTSSANHQATP